jgi:hypothetical protein
VAMAFGLRLCRIVFSIETFAGLLEGKGFEDTIQSAFMLGGMFWGLGLLLCEVARQVVEELVRSQLKNPAAEPEHKTPSSTDK